MAIADRINEMYTHVGDVYDTITNVDLPTNKNIQNIPQTIKDSYLEIMNNGIDRIWNNWEKVTGSGTSISLSPTLKAPMKNELKGNTSQTGTPTPTSPIDVDVVSGDNSVVVQGKNLFDNTLLNQEENYNTYNSSTNKWTTNSGGGYARSILYGVTGTNSNRNIAKLIKLLPNKTYTLTFYDFTRTTTDNNYLNLAFFDSTGAIIGSSIDTKDNPSFTTPNQECYLDIRRSNNSGTFTFSNIQIEVGSSSTPYDTYTSTTYPINLPVENLFDISKITESTYLSYDGSTGSSSVTNMSDYMQILPSKPCTISYTYTTLMNTNPRGYCWYTENKTFISGDTYSPFVNDIPVTLTAPSNAKYIRFAYDKNCTNIQLQQSSKATPYGTTPIELCKIGNYQDYIYKDSDKWYLHKEIGKVVLDGSELWQMHGSIASWFYVDNLIYSISANARKDFILSDYFVQNSYSYATTITNGELVYSYQVGGGPARLVLKDTDYTTVADFKTWLSTHNVTLYYVLLEATNIEITYQPLIDQLNELEKAISYENQTNISQINNDLPFIISASALKKG